MLNTNFHFSLEEINSKILITSYDYYETDLNFKFRQKIKKFFKNYVVLNGAGGERNNFLSMICK
jgi:hypothetical protein